MKKALLAAAAVLTLSGAGAVAAAPPASAGPGCGLTVEVHNTGTDSATVNWSASDSRARPFGVVGWWNQIGSGSTTVSGGDERSVAWTLDFSCNTSHQIRLHVTEDGSSRFVESAWETDSVLHIHV
jgi:hypothetical protein